MNKETEMSQDIKGEYNIYSRNGFQGVELGTGAVIGYRTGIRKPPGEQGPDTGDEQARLLARYPKPTGPARDLGNVPNGAEPPKEPPPQVENVQVDANNVQIPADEEEDLRAILKVPPYYLSGEFGNLFVPYGGILFPYSPSIQVESKADYTDSGPLHSNYPINFYKSSAISDIGMTANFTVQGPRDAGYYLGAIRILSALTKMKFGGDAMAGTPPPICRLFAYGEYMIKNVPVVITSFRHDMPDDTDYYRAVVNNEQVMVPTKSQFTINYKVTYSRKEMMEAGVDAFISGDLYGRGYL